MKKALIGSGTFMTYSMYIYCVSLPSQHTYSLCDL